MPASWSGTFSFGVHRDKRVTASRPRIMAHTGLGFSPEQQRVLDELGVTAKQRQRLQRRFQLVRDSVLGTGTATGVFAALTKLSKHLDAANRIARQLANASEGSLWLANGVLSQGGVDALAQMKATEAERSEGELPEFVNVALLAALLNTAAAIALSDHCNKSRVAPAAPWRAIEQIVIALGDIACVVTRAEGSPFVRLVATVFDAATDGVLRTGKQTAMADSTLSESRPDVDRAIRAYLKRQDASPKNLPP